MSSEKSSVVRMVIVLLIFIIGVPVGMYFLNQKTINYRMNGTEVTATVISVESKRVRGTDRITVTVTYENEDGEIITAKAINPGNVYENDTIVGRVVPEKPEEVFLEPPMWQTIVAYGVAGLFFFGSLILLIAMVIGKKTEKQMSRQGKITEATITRRELIDGSIFVDVEFRDDNGILRRGSCRAPEYMDTAKPTCTIRYLAKSDKKTICEMSM